MLDPNSTVCIYVSLGVYMRAHTTNVTLYIGRWQMMENPIDDEEPKENP
jgi:hypothetical protein